jgi:hypothetical protein
MPVYTLECIDKDRRNTFWSLHLEPDFVMLVMPDGRQATRFPRPQATERIDMPSFWRSNPGLMVYLADGEPRCFRKDRAVLRSVQDYLDGTLAATGAEAVAELRRRGLKHMAIGLPLLAAGVGLAYWYAKAFGELPSDELRAYPLYLPGVAGLLVTYSGLRKWAAARAAARYSAREAARSGAGPRV